MPTSAACRVGSSASGERRAASGERRAASGDRLLSSRASAANPLSSRASGASRGICTLHAAIAAPEDSRGARGARGGTAHAEDRSRSRDRRPHAPLLSLHDPNTVFCGPGKRSPRPGSVLSPGGRSWPTAAHPLPPPREPHSRTGQHTHAAQRPLHPHGADPAVSAQSPFSIRAPSFEKRTASERRLPRPFSHPRIPAPVPQLPRVGDTSDR